jgi:hypothetical protein
LKNALAYYNAGIANFEVEGLGPEITYSLEFELFGVKNVIEIQSGLFVVEL